MTRGRKIGIAISLIFLLIGISWSIYNYYVTNPAYNKKMACIDEKTKLLDQAAIALDKGDTTLGDQLRLQADNIQGC